MCDICGDNRFEIIGRAKKALIESTNIETSPKEMEVLNDFLFRCWQMGWLDKYEIVRCKDCRHWKNFNNVQGICHERPNIITTEQYNDFCSHAERNEETVPVIEVELTEEAKAKMKGGTE